MASQISDQISYLVSALESKIKNNEIGSDEALNIVDQIRLKNLELSRQLEGNSFEFMANSDVRDAELELTDVLEFVIAEYKLATTESIVESFSRFLKSSNFCGWYQPPESEPYIWSGPKTESTIVLSGLSGARYFGFKVRCNVEESVDLKSWLSTALNSSAVRYDYAVIGDEIILVLSKPIEVDCCEIDFFLKNIYSPKEIFSSPDERRLGICVSGAWKVSGESKFELL